MKLTLLLLILAIASCSKPATLRAKCYDCTIGSQYGSMPKDTSICTEGEPFIANKPFVCRER